MKRSDRIAASSRKMKIKERAMPGIVVAVVVAGLTLGTGAVEARPELQEQPPTSRPTPTPLPTSRPPHPKLPYSASLPLVLSRYTQ